MRLQTEKPVIKDYCDLFMFLQEKGFILNQLDDFWLIEFDKVDHILDDNSLYFVGDIGWYKYTVQVPVVEIFLPESWLFEFLIVNDMLDKKYIKNDDNIPTSYFINVENMPEVDQRYSNFWAMYFCTLDKEDREETLINLIKK